MRRATVIVFLVCVAGLTASGARAAAELLPNVLLSRQLMRDANLAVGDTIVLAADPEAAQQKQFRVAGVYKPVPHPMKLQHRTVRKRGFICPDLVALTADVSDPQAMDTVTAINLKLREGARLSDVIRAIGRRNPRSSHVRRRGRARAIRSPRSNGFTWRLPRLRWSAAPRFCSP